MDWITTLLGSTRAQILTLLRRSTSTIGDLAGSVGIGGIGDMYLCPEAGHRLAANDETGINHQFLLMLAKVNHLAREVLVLSSPMR